jgi:hypothetical protein
LISDRLRAGPHAAYEAARVSNGVGKGRQAQPTAARPIGKLRHVGTAVSVGNVSVAIPASSGIGTRSQRCCRRRRFSWSYPSDRYPREAILGPDARNDRREPVFHARGGRKRKGESPRRLRGDRWGKGKEEYAPGSLIVSIWYRTNRRGEYNVLATLCKGLGTRILKFFCALHPQRLIKTYNIRCSRCIPGSKCCENTKFRRVVAALHFTPVFGCTPLCGWGVEIPSRVDLRRVTVEAVTRRFEVLPRVAPTAQEP